MQELDVKLKQLPAWELATYPGEWRLVGLPSPNPSSGLQALEGG